MLTAVGSRDGICSRAMESAGGGWAVGAALEHSEMQMGSREKGECKDPLWSLKALLESELGARDGVCARGLQALKTPQNHVPDAL